MKIKTLLLSLLFSLCAIEGTIFASENPIVQEKKVKDQKKDKIKRLYKFPEKFMGRKCTTYYYILDDGYSLFQFLDNAQKGLIIGDKVTVYEPFDDADEDGDVTVKKDGCGKAEYMGYIGIASPEYTIQHITITGSDPENRVVKIILDDGTSWQMESFEEHEHGADKWKVGERIVIFINTEEKKQQVVDYPIQNWSPEWECIIINLDSKYHNSTSEETFLIE